MQITCLSNDSKVPVDVPAYMHIHEPTLEWLNYIASGPSQKHTRLGPAEKAVQGSEKRKSSLGTTLFRDDLAAFPHPPLLTFWHGTTVPRSGPPPAPVWPDPKPPKAERDTPSLCYMLGDTGHTTTSTRADLLLPTAYGTLHIGTRRGGSSSRINGMTDCPIVIPKLHLTGACVFKRAYMREVLY